jgi:hypothetical protein
VQLLNIPSYVVVLGSWNLECISVKFIQYANVSTHEIAESGDINVSGKVNNVHSLNVLFKIGAGCIVLSISSSVYLI